MKALVNLLKAVIAILLIAVFFQVNAQNINSKTSESSKEINAVSYCQEAVNFNSNSPVDFINHIKGNVDNLKVYPNPAKDKITIEISINNTELINYAIYNLEGKLVASDIIPSGNPGAIVNTNNLLNGIYFLSVIYGDRKINSKIVISH